MKDDTLYRIHISECVEIIFPTSMAWLKVFSTPARESNVYST